MHRHNCIAAILLLAASPTLAQSNPPPPASPSGKPLAFTIVSIRPHGNAPAAGGSEGCNIDRCHFAERPLLAFIMVAYNLSAKAIIGDPLSGDADLFDLDAKIDPADMPATPLTSAQLAAMLQPILADRFQLRVHRETRTFSVYDLVITKGSVKMKESAPGSSTRPASAPLTGCYHTSIGNGLRIEHDCTMQDIANILQGPSGRTIVDKTKLTGRYDLDLHWTPDNTPADSPIAGGPSILNALQEQLGLKLEPSIAPLEVLIVDSAQKPSPN